MLGLASKPLPTIGILGLRGQRMTTRARHVEVFQTPGPGTFRAKARGWHLILLYGPGGSGGSSPGTAASGGGGGGAALKRVFLNEGDVVSYTIGTSASGSPSSASIAGRFSFSAFPGSTGGVGFVAGALGGLGVGGDINRAGGRGLGNTNPNGDPDDDDGVVLPATDGEWGGKGDPSTGGAFGGGGGGGGAGFRDILANLAGNGGSTGLSLPVGSPGGGGLGGIFGNPGGPGGDGAVAFIYEA